MLNTDEKPTRPPVRKFKLTTKPPVTSSQTRTTTTAARKVATAAKLQRKPPRKEAKKKSKPKPWKKTKMLNKKYDDAQTKKSMKKSKSQVKKTAAMKPVRVKAKTNQTLSQNLNTRKVPNNLKDNKINTKRSNPRKKGVEKQTGLKTVKAESVHPTSSNKTESKVNVKISKHKKPV